MSSVLYRTIFGVIFLGIFWITTRYFKEKPFPRLIMATSLFYGLLIVILVRLIFGDILEHPAYFPDAYSYLTYAATKAAEWKGEGALGYIPLPMRGYTYFIAVVYSLFGQNIYAVIFVQLLLASMIPILTFLIARELFSVKIAKLSALLIAFFPDLYVWASFALKEIIATFSICLAVFQFLKFRKHQRLDNFLFTMGPIALLLFVRPHIALFLGFVFILTFIWPITFRKLIWSAIIIAGFAISMSQAGLSNLLTIISKTPILVYNRGETLVTGTLPELLRMLINGQLLSNFLIGMGRYLVSPLPWQASNAYQAVIPGIILWYFLLPAAIWGVIGSVKTRKHVHILLLIVLFLIVWYGFVSTGTDPRWRLMIVPFMSIFSAYGFRLLARSLSGVMLWISGVLGIWLFLSAYAFGIKFVFWILVPTLVIGVLVVLRPLYRCARVTR